MLRWLLAYGISKPLHVTTHLCLLGYVVPPMSFEHAHHCPIVTIQPKDLLQPSKGFCKVDSSLLRLIKPMPALSSVSTLRSLYIAANTIYK